MNKKEFTYENFLNLLTKHNIEIVTKETYEPSIMLQGEHLYLKDPYGYLNENGNYYITPVVGTIDLSGDGFTFNKMIVEEKYKKVVDFYAEKDFDWFKNKIKELSYGYK